MSRKAWVVLIGMVLLSVLLAGVTTWAIKRPPRPLPGLPIVGPTYGIPIPPRRPVVPPPSRPLPQPRPPLPTRLRPLLPWRGAPLFIRPHPIWQVTRVIASEIFLFLVATMAFLLFPRRLLRCRRALEQGAWSAFVMGFVGTLVMTLLGLLAMFSALGWIILPWLLLLYAFVWLMGLIVAALQLGGMVRQLFRVPDDVWMLDLALGVVLLVMLGLLPVVGWIFFLLLGMGGMGAVILTRFGSSQGWDFSPTFEGELRE